MTVLSCNDFRIACQSCESGTKADIALNGSAVSGSLSETRTDQFMKASQTCVFRMLPILVATVLSISLARGQNTNSASPLASQGPKANAGTNFTSVQPISPTVGEIIRMADAGVSSNVITAYIQNSSARYALTDADVIALNKHNVPDEIITLLLKRGAEARAAAQRSRDEVLRNALASRTMGNAGMDPEGYDYFRYHYLQPRAVESMYQRLSPYYYYPPVPYAYGRPFRHW